MGGGGGSGPGEEEEEGAGEEGKQGAREGRRLATVLMHSYTFPNFLCTEEIRVQATESESILASVRKNRSMQHHTLGSGISSNVTSEGTY